MHYRCANKVKLIQFYYVYTESSERTACRATETATVTYLIRDVTDDLHRPRTKIVVLCHRDTLGVI